MKIDIGESLVNSYLRHVKGCRIVQQNWKPSGNWQVGDDLLEKTKIEFERIQRHKAFTEIFKTGFDQTVRQTELDVLGMGPGNTLYGGNVTFHEFGINFGSKTDTRNRVIKNLLRAYLAMKCYFPEFNHVLMFCAPRVSVPTEEIIREYFRIIEKDFSNEQTRFLYLSNDTFRDEILMHTLERIPEEFDTNELFVRSFKLLTVYAHDIREEEPAPPRETSGKKKVERKKKKEENNPEHNNKPGEQNIERAGGQEGQPDKPELENENNVVPDEERIRNEVAKVISRVPKWFTRPGQNNSRILIRFMELYEKKDKITLQELAEACSEVRNFSGNFTQMNNVADKNHGKVFNGTSDNIQLWEPIREFVIQEYIEFKKSYYSS